MKHMPVPEIPLRRYIDINSCQITDFPEHITVSDLLECYRTMVLIRAFDKKAVALQRTGQMGTYATSLGQEAISTAVGYCMSSEDVLAPYYRDQAAHYLRGVPLHASLAYWGGNEYGNHVPGQPAQDLPTCVPIATQITHAAGIAAAIKIRGQKRAVVTTCGDGATSRGDFYEAMNLAGAWQLPLVIVVNNNQWAISVPGAIQTAAASIAHKAYAAGVDALRVDGNDTVAMLDAMRIALHTAREGKGCTLIEALSYRLGDHTTADDATRYRRHDEVATAWENEPVKRLQIWLHRNGHWNENLEQQWLAHCNALIQSEVDRYLDMTPQTATDFFSYVFEEMPAPLQSQMHQFNERMQRSEGTHHGR